MNAPGEDCGSKGKWFTTTHWSVIFRAKAVDSAAAAEGLNRLFETYRPCVIAFIQRDGYGAADAEDHAHDFFKHLMAKDFLDRLGQKEGKFRTFLLKFLTNFLSDIRDKAKAQKRGGGKAILSLDELVDQTSGGFEPVDTLTPDQTFDRRWADVLLGEAVKRLRATYKKSGKLALFDELQDFQPGEHGPTSYAQLGKRFGLSEGAIKSEVHRMRERHRKILLDEISQTLAREEDLPDEIQYLMELVGRPLQ
jgi:RNA polymerase sigma factor (sigma-70 family)